MLFSNFDRKEMSDRLINDATLSLEIEKKFIIKLKKKRN